MYCEHSYNVDCNKTWDNGEVRASLKDNWFVSLILNSLLWALHYELTDKPEKWIVNSLTEAEEVLSRAQFNGVLV